MPVDTDFPACGGIPDHPVPSIYAGPCPPGANADWKDIRTSNTRPPETVTGLRICVGQTTCRRPGPQGPPETCPSPYPENETQTCRTIGSSYFLWLADDNNGDGRPGTFAVLEPGQRYGYVRDREGRYHDAYGRVWRSLSDRHPEHEWQANGDRTDYNHDYMFGLCTPLAALPCPTPTPASPPPAPSPSPQPSVSPSPAPSAPPAGGIIPVQLHACPDAYPRRPDYVKVGGWFPAGGNKDAHLVNLSPFMRGARYCADENGGSRMFTSGPYAGMCEMWAPCVLQGLSAEDAVNANPPQPVVKDGKGEVLNTWKEAVRGWGPGWPPNGDEVERRSRLCEREDSGFVPADWIGHLGCINYYLANFVIGPDGSPPGTYTVCAAPTADDIRGLNDVKNGECRTFDWR